MYTLVPSKDLDFSVFLTKEEILKADRETINNKKTNYKYVSEYSCWHTIGKIDYENELDFNYKTLLAYYYTASICCGYDEFFIKSIQKLSYEELLEGLVEIEIDLLRIKEEALGRLISEWKSLHTKRDKEYNVV